MTLADEYECGCGLRTPIFKGGVEGRRSESIILPNGTVFPAASFAVISVDVFNKMKTRKVKQFQIVQNKLDEIDILLVIDEDLRDSYPTLDELAGKLKEFYQEKVGPEININVKEVKDIPAPPNKPVQQVISRLTQKEREDIINRSL